MDQIVLSLIESGCYSAVFAILLVYVVRSGMRREKCYRDVICELADGLKAMDVMNGKLDRLLEICEKTDRERKKKRKATPCDYTMRSISEAEPS